MPRVFPRPLTRDTGIQKIKVPADAVPVAFMNRGGDPTVYFKSSLSKTDLTLRESILCLTTNQGETPTPSAVFIGMADFASGQYVYAAWELNPIQAAAAKAEEGAEADAGHA